MAGLKGDAVQVSIANFGFVRVGELVGVADEKLGISANCQRRRFHLGQAHGAQHQQGVRLVTANLRIKIHPPGAARPALDPGTGLSAQSAPLLPTYHGSFRRAFRRLRSTRPGTEFALFRIIRSRLSCLAPTGRQQKALPAKGGPGKLLRRLAQSRAAGRPDRNGRQNNCAPQGSGRSGRPVAPPGTEDRPVALQEDHGHNPPVLGVCVAGKPPVARAVAAACAGLTQHRLTR